MSESKLPHAIGSVIAAFFGWVVSHGSGIVLALSGVAAIYSAYATYVTLRVKRLEEKHLRNIDPDL